MNTHSPTHAHASNPSPPADSHDHHRRRAVFWVRCVGLIETAFFGFFTAAALTALFKNTTHDTHSPQPTTTTACLWIGILGLAHSLFYLIASFGIRSGNKPSIRSALLLISTQSLVCAALLLQTLRNALTHTSPTSFTISVLTLGTPTLLLSYTAFCLLKADRSTATTNPHPHDQPHPHLA
jgi:hypothetical protein